MILNGIREGCWLTPDPLGGDITNPQSLNRYAYALNNPATLTDPSGLSCQDPTDGQPCVITVTAQAPPPIPPSQYPGCVAYGSEGCIQPPCGELPGVVGCGGIIHITSYGASGGGSAHHIGFGILDTPENLYPFVPVGRACSAQASAFVSANSTYANQIAQRTGVPATNLLGLSALESNFGTSNLATNYNNFFGLTVGSAFKGTTGIYTTPDGRKFGIYPSPGFLTSGMSFAQSFQGNRVNGVTDPTAFAKLLTTPPLAFNSEPGYASKLVQRINQVSPCQ